MTGGIFVLFTATTCATTYHHLRLAFLLPAFYTATLPIPPYLLADNERDRPHFSTAPLRRRHARHLPPPEWGMVIRTRRRDGAKGGRCAMTWGGDVRQSRQSRMM